MINLVNTALFLSHHLKQNSLSVATASSFASVSTINIQPYFSKKSFLSSTSTPTPTELSNTMPSYEFETPSLKIAQFVCLDDNYGYLVHNKETGETTAIDTPCGSTYKEELKKRGWTLTDIWNTHHHWDHTGANLELKEAYKAKIQGDNVDKIKIPGIDNALSHGDDVSLGNVQAKVIDVGGHTKGHIAYYFPTEDCVFVGDALFTLGCGKMFEGTADQFWASLQRLRALPPQTKVFCAHEYTMGNAKFASWVEPNNNKLQNRVKVLKELRSEDKPTVPSTIGDEIDTNPFLRGDVSEEIQKNVNAVGVMDYAKVFGMIRHAKDTFRG